MRIGKGYFSKSRGKRTIASHCSPTLPDLSAVIRNDSTIILVYLMRLCRAVFCLPLSNSVSAELASCSGSPELSLKVFILTPIIINTAVYFVFFDLFLSQPSGPVSKIVCFCLLFDLIVLY